MIASLDKGWEEHFLNQDQLKVYQKLLQKSILNLKKDDFERSEQKRRDGRELKEGYCLT